MVAEQNPLPTPFGRANKVKLIFPKLAGEYGIQIKRDFDAPIDIIWHYLTEPDALAEWAPFDAHQSLDGAVGQAIVLIMAGVDGEKKRDENRGVEDENSAPLDLIESEILASEKPTLLSYNWGSDRLQFDGLAVAENLTELTLTQMVTEPEYLAQNAAGWHLCLDVLALALSGASPGRIVGKTALKYGFARLVGQYQQKFQSDIQSNIQSDIQADIMAAGAGRKK